MQKPKMQSEFLSNDGAKALRWSYYQNLYHPPDPVFPVLCSKRVLGYGYNGRRTVQSHFDMVSK